VRQPAYPGLWDDGLIAGISTNLEFAWSLRSNPSTLSERKNDECNGSK